MTDKLLESSKLVTAIRPQDIGTSDITGPTYYSVKGYRRIRAKLLTGALTSGQTGTLQLMQATDAAGTGAKVLGTTSTYTAPGGGGDADLEIEVKALELDVANGFTFIGARAGSGTNGIIGGVVLEFGESDYLPVR